MPDRPLAVPQAATLEDEVAPLLESLVIDLGLAADAQFVPTDAELGPDGGEIDLPVPGRLGHLEGHLRCRPRDDAAVPLLADLAVLAGQAMGQAARAEELHHREALARRVAERLQDSLLPPLPNLPGTALAVHYRPATKEARVGGDFYDAFPLPDRGVLLVVGDVMGKGVEAAGRTSMITQTLRALALQELALDELLERADEQISFQDEDLMATVWCGLYEPVSGELQFASLGHPPALLLRADGESTWLTLEGLPLGMRDLAEGAPECRSRRLSSRDLLVLYTDGVVESSGDLGAGQDMLLDAVARRRDETVHGLIGDALDELLSEGGHTDDALMLLLRRR